MNESQSRHMTSKNSFVA